MALTVIRAVAGFHEPHTSQRVPRQPARRTRLPDDHLRVSIRNHRLIRNTGVLGLPTRPARQRFRRPTRLVNINIGRRRGCSRWHVVRDRQPRRPRRLRIIKPSDQKPHEPNNHQQGDHHSPAAKNTSQHNSPRALAGGATPPCLLSTAAPPRRSSLLRLGQPLCRTTWPRATSVRTNSIQTQNLSAHHVSGGCVECHRLASNNEWRTRTTQAT